MLKLGVTGGIGSGKSIACRIFSILGAPVYDADEKAKLLVNTDEEIRNAIFREFGSESFVNSTYNRQFIASVVFKDKKKLQLLNRIIHPAVEEDFKKWYQMQNYYYIIHEAAILFESGTDKFMDYTLLIDAPENYRIDRVIKRDKTTQKEVELRLRNQWPANKISKMADWVIVNDGKTLILPQILKIHHYLIQSEKSHG